MTFIRYAMMKRSSGLIKHKKLFSFTTESTVVIPIVELLKAQDHRISKSLDDSICRLEKAVEKNATEHKYALEKSATEHRDALEKMAKTQRDAAMEQREAIKDFATTLYWKWLVGVAAVVGVVGPLGLAGFEVLGGKLIPPGKSL